MRRDPAAIRPTLTDDEPGRDRHRIPATLLRDPRRQPPLPVERPDQLVDVDDLRLELDDQQCAPTRMPGQDVDHAALAVDRERDFGRQDPGRQLARNRRATDSWSAECRRLISRSRSPPRQRGTRSSRISSAAPTSARCRSTAVRCDRARSARSPTARRPTWPQGPSCRQPLRLAREPDHGRRTGCRPSSMPSRGYPSRSIWHLLAWVAVGNASPLAIYPSPDSSAATTHSGCLRLEHVG